MAPSAKQLTKAAEGIFFLEDWHNFGPYYATTLQHWYENFIKHWPKFKNQYGDRFYRMWVYYLMAGKGAALSHDGTLWQIVFSKHGVDKGYKSIR